MIDLYGYESRAQNRTFNTYEDVHCHLSASIHDYIKYIKLGYSKVTDHASREIRLKRMTRDEGIEMVRKYSSLEPNEDDLNLFLKWADIDRDYFFECINKFRDPSIWEKDSSNNWILKDSILNHIKDENTADVALEKIEDCNYLLTEVAAKEDEDEFLLMGRSYVDRFHFGSIKDMPSKGSLTPRKWRKGDIG